MAEHGKLRNITTAIAALFSPTKPGEFTARNSIEKALAATKRDAATKPVLDPTALSKKGVGIGSIIADINGIGKNYHKYLERETLRHMRYIIYDRMDNDLISSALDVYANESTQKNNEGKIIGVHSTSPYIQDEIKEMLQDTGLNNFRSWSIIRNMCKYGDHFSSVLLDSVAGVVGLLDVDPASVYRLEENGNLMGYIQDLDVIKSAIVNTTTTNTNPYINLNTLTMPYLINNEESDKDEDIIPFLKYEMVHFRLRGRGAFLSYGSSVLECATDVWKKLDLLFDSLIIYRLNRAPSRMIFYVDVGNNQGADAENMVKRQINAITKKEYFGSNGKLNERYQLLDMNANLYIPVQKNSTTKVEQLPGAQAVGEIEDVAFLNNRLFAALKVPKSFLGYEGDVSSKGMLSQQNVTFSKAIQNIQEDFLESVKDLCLIHLAIRGVSDIADLKSFDLVMSRPSYIEEKAKIELDSALMQLAGTYQTFGVNRPWIAKNILSRTDAEVTEMFQPDPTQPVSPDAGGMGGGMPMGGGMDMGMGAPPDMGAPPMTGAGGAPPMPDAGGGAPVPLTQSVKYIGGLLLETTDSVLTIRHPGKQLKTLISHMNENGFKETRTTKTGSIVSSLLDSKKRQLTEPEQLFD